MRYWVVLSVCLCVCSCAIETIFLLSNFKTKHIFGNLMALRKFEDHLGRRRKGIERELCMRVLRYEFDEI